MKGNFKVKKPADKTIKVKVENGTFWATLQWATGFASKYAGQFYRAQVFVDQEVIRLSDPLTPMRTKTLIRSGETGTTFGSGQVQYNSPYGRYQYYGKVMVGKAPKKLTNRNLTYEGAPQRGALWFERMKAANLESIRKGAEDYATGKKK